MKENSTCYDESYNLSDDDSEDNYEDLSPEAMKLRLSELEGKHSRFVSLISQHRHELIATIGQENFNELYQLFKSKIHVGVK